MKRVVTLERRSRHMAALHRRVFPRHRAVRALPPSALLLLATLAATASGWPASVFASDWSTDSTATTEVESRDEPEATEPSQPPTEPTEEPPVEKVTKEPTIAPEPTEEPLPTSEPTEEPAPEPLPLLTLTATVACFAENGGAGLLQLDLAEAPATITDGLAVVAPETTAQVRLDVLLPATLVPGVAIWQWWLDDPQVAQPIALLVRVAGLLGDEVANIAAGDRGTGWLLAPVTQPVEGCPLPESPIDPTPEFTRQDQGGNPTGSVSDPSKEPATEPTPETIATEPTPATPIAEETETPIATPTEAATIEPVASPEPDASPAASATAEPDPIEIQLLSDDGEARPGKSARYRFRITNTTDAPLTVRITTTDSIEGWSSTIYEADGTTKLPTDVHLDPGESIDVIVRVTPPVEARPGDQNVTALDAQPAKTAT